MGKLGEMASERNEKWTEMNLGIIAKGQDRYWAKWKKGEVGNEKKKRAKREKIGRNGNGQNGIGRTGNKQIKKLIAFTITSIGLFFTSSHDE